MFAQIKITIGPTLQVLAFLNHARDQVERCGRHDDEIVTKYQLHLNNVSAKYLCYANIIDIISTISI